MSAGSSQTVLIVEDEASIASFISLYLKNSGYEVRSAATGAEAVRQLQAGPISLILLDLMLPDVDGIELARRLRQRWDIPILMLTARDEDVDKIIGLVLTRDQLLERVWGYTFAGDTRTVDVHVRQLRRKLGEASPIVTVWGVGYKVAPARDAAVNA